LSDWALWLKALHIIAFAAWMAAMWYLPRLLVYHSAAPIGGEASETFKVMERRLLKAIGTPAMVATFLFGILLATAQDQWVDGWLHVKLLLVLILAACHGLLARDVRQFAGDSRPRSERYYRIFNEVPTVLFIGIVFLVILKPFF
jgi:putative membrane protein